MSIWDSIGNAFKEAGDAIANAATTVGNAVASGAVDVFDFSKNVLTSAALQTGDGANIFSAGWRDVFSGDFKDGLHSIAMGLGECVGVVPPAMAQRYEEALGIASLWSLRMSKNTDQRVCYSVYLSQVKSNILSLGLEWNDSMQQACNDGLGQMPWINPKC